MKKVFVILLLFSMSSNIFSQKDENVMAGYKKVSYKEINENAIKLIGDDWMLITAGSLNTKFNMMTASWGGLGNLWNKPVSFIFVRPQRYTYQFLEKETYYTISFYDEKYRDALKICGTKSGRDCDKVKESGLTPVATESGSVAFTEARLIIECKKLYSTKINESDFIDKELIKDIYPSKDFHKMFIGEIVNIWVKK